MKLRVFIISFCWALVLYGQNIGSAPDSYVQKAEEWASMQYNGQIDDGTPYYAVDQSISAWVFNVYRSVGTFPSKDDILTTVKYYYDKRIQAEENRQYELIKEYFDAMRNDEEFATVFIAGSVEKPYVSVSYCGLPPHYLSIYDAEQKVKSFTTDNMNEVRFYYLDPSNIFARYKNDFSRFFVNLVFLDEDVALDIDLRKPKKELFPVVIPEIKSSIEPRQKLRKPLTDAEIMIEGVPDYKSVHPDPDYNFSKGCVPVSAAMALGYWDDRGYGDLIDGGGSSYAGTKSTDGYLGFINNELGPDMGYVPGSGTYFPGCYDDIETTCNNTNSYDFDCAYDSYCSWTEFCDEIDAGRPFLLEYGSYAWVQQTNESWFQSRDHAVTGVGYKYINDGTYNYDRWYIIHFNSYYVGNPYYMCDSSMHHFPSRVTVTPGGGSWSGSLGYNTMWSGDVTVTGDVTIPSGKTLIILSGTTVTFDDSDDQSSGKSPTKPEIIVKGILKADNVTFTAATKGDWYGIWFDSLSTSASEASYLKNSTLENGDYPLWVDNCYPTIDGNTISNASGTGIVVKGSGATSLEIKNCSISNVDNIGMSVV